MPAKRDTGGHILTEWPFCYVKSAIEHKRRYAHHFLAVRTSYFSFVLTPDGYYLVSYATAGDPSGCLGDLKKRTGAPQNRCA